VKHHLYPKDIKDCLLQGCWTHFKIFTSKLPTYACWTFGTNILFQDKLHVTGWDVDAWKRKQKRKNGI